jgi:CBS domain-containing protein
MPQHIRDVMTSNPCTIDANESVAYAAKMMREEDVGLAPIVQGDRLIGMLTDRDIATRVAAEGRNPDQVKVRDVASTQLVTIAPQQELDDALRMMAKHQVRRLPVVGEDGRLVGVVAQADIARAGDDSKTGQLVEEISESGGQMSSIEEGQQFPRQVEDQPESLVSQEVEPGLIEAQPDEAEVVSKVQAASSRGRKRRTTSRKRSTARKSSGGTRKRKTTSRKKSSTGARKRKTTSRKRSTAKRKTAARKSIGTRKRKTTGRKKAAGTRKRKTTARKKSAGTRKRKTTGRKKAAGTRKRKTTGRKKAAGTRKRKTTGRKKAAGTRKRKTTGRKKAAGTRKRKTTSRKRSTAKRSTAKRKTAARRSTASRKTSTRRRTTRRKSR